MTEPVAFGRNTGSGAPRGFGASNLRVCYDDTLALDDVSVDVPDGQVTAVVGGDGAGKTSPGHCNREAASSARPAHARSAISRPPRASTRI